MPGLTSALKTSLVIAPVSAVVATILGTFLGLALGRYWFRGRAPVNFLIFLAIAVPEIVLGSSLLSMFVLANSRCRSSAMCCRSAFGRSSCPTSASPSRSWR